MAGKRSLERNSRSAFRHPISDAFGKRQIKIALVQVQNFPPVVLPCRQQISARYSHSEQQCLHLINSAHRLGFDAFRPTYLEPTANAGPSGSGLKNRQLTSCPSIVNARSTNGMFVVVMSQVCPLMPHIRNGSAADAKGSTQR